MSAHPPLVAVCLCTRKRPQMLRRCVDSLLRQGRAEAFRWTLIVVDNNESDELSAADALRDLPQDMIAVVREPRAGIPIARNRGLEAALEAGADFIVFMDDDEVAPPGWLRALVACIEDNDADVVQGGVTQTTNLADLAAPAPIEKAKATRPAETAATCNTIMRAWIAQPPVGLRFDETMRYTGGSDLEYFMRAHQKGARILRAKGLDVIEERVASRETLNYRAVRSFSSGSNYFFRVSKNCSPPVAAARIVLRAIDRLLSGLLTLASWPVMAVVSSKRARDTLGKAYANLCFAAGCVSPAFGWRHEPYRQVVGA